MTRFDDETLMAFADGALDEPAAAEVARAVSSDPALAARVAAMVRSRDLVRELHAPLADLPVPPALAARIEAMAAGGGPAGAGVVSLADRRASRPAAQGPAPWRMAAAAAVAALVAGAAGYIAGGARTGPEEIAVAAALPADVGDLLSALPSGAETPLDGGRRMRPIATFRDAAGEVCREFEVDGTTAVVAVACRTNGAWRVAFAVEAPLSDGYAPASSMTALDAWLGAVGAGEPMEPEEEIVVLAEKSSPPTE